MIQVFKTDEEYVKWLDGQRLPSGIVVYVSDNETMYFTTNNIKGELKTYECKKEEPIQYPPLVYSTNAAGSTITVNGQSMTLEQGDNMVLNYATAITSVKATSNTALTYIQIPNTVTSIESNSFEGCTALTDFNFNGTMAQWGAITLGTDWKNNAAFTVVHCTDGDVTLEQPIQPIQHEYVDLGLPSGLKWAKCNVGAESETDYGSYFMWGSTRPNTPDECIWAKAPFNGDYPEYNADAFNQVKDTVCPNGILAKGYDAAAQIMGGDWRMPTEAECRELYKNTTQSWVTINGVKGRKFTSKTDTTKYIFIPAAGYCSNGTVDYVDGNGSVWSSSLNTVNTHNAWNLGFGSNYCDMDFNYRYYGQSVRGVRK